MELRHQVALCSQWLFGWGGSLGSTNILPIGKEGVLRSVDFREATPQHPAHLIIRMEFNGRICSGAISEVDEAFLKSLLQFLGEDDWLVDP
jgi:hypothetical protein